MYDIMRDCKGMKIEEKFDFLGTKLTEITHCLDKKRCILDRIIRYFKTEFKQRWVSASRKEESFLSKNDLHHLYGCKSLVQKLYINKAGQQNHLKFD